MRNAAVGFVARLRLLQVRRSHARMLQQFRQRPRIPGGPRPRDSRQTRGQASQSLLGALTESDPWPNRNRSSESEFVQVSISGWVR
jgi:hypothetical protein